MSSEPEWLRWARELQAISQTGIAYSHNTFDTERYEQMRALAARMMAAYSDLPAGKIGKLFTDQVGYTTPKVDVRGAIFKDGKVLLASEIIDGGRWTLPGGWADVNMTPAENVAREVAEEAGLVVEPYKLAMVLDRARAGHTPPLAFSIYKLFFLCRVTGTCKKRDDETGDPRYFDLNALPELSVGRVLPGQIRRLYQHFQDPSLPTDFN